MTAEGDKKIIVDDDWKSRVEAEREALRTSPGAAASPSAGESLPPPPTGEAAASSAYDSATAADRAAEQRAAHDDPYGALPPASFPMLVTMLATQALAAFEGDPHAEAAQREPHLRLARHFIDTLAMLEAKTRGNLSAEEAEHLSGVLHQLRLAYVAVQQQSAR